MYAEGMPAPCSTPNTGRYAVKHNPFLYYPSVTASAAYCACTTCRSPRSCRTSLRVPLPAFSFVSPDLCNDMHSCPIATGDAWLAQVVPQILGSPAFTTRAVAARGDLRRRRQLATTWSRASSPARPRAAGAVSSAPYTHYSLLRTIENGLGLPPLSANDAAATPMTDLLAR